MRNRRTLTKALSSPVKPTLTAGGNDFIFGIHTVKETLLHQRQRVVGLYLTEGLEQLNKIAHIAQSQAAQITYLPKASFMAHFGQDLAHQGVALAVRPFPYVDLAQALSAPLNLCLVLDGVEDPRNVGRAARSAFAMGASLMIIPKDRAAPITAACEKAAAGALAHLRVAQVTNLNRALAELKQAGLWIVGTASTASLNLSECDLTKPIALVIGNEEKGLRHSTEANCDELVSIPMAAGLDFSFNAADAAAICLYETCRQRAAVG